MKTTIDLLNHIKGNYLSAINTTQTSEELKTVKANYLGKKGQISVILRSLSKLDAEQRKNIGSISNQLKIDIEQAVEVRQAELTSGIDDALAAVDLSLPIRDLQRSGHGHPTQLVLDEIYEVFLRLGYAIVDGPEVETDWYNFEALNMPPEHPARDMQDTFYLVAEPGIKPLVPRTHTSSAQIRYLEKHRPPFKIIVPGKVYRNEDEDRTHSWTFFQVEGLVVGETVSMADLKGTLLHCVQSLLGSDVKVRFRPSFFPYTEPSVEVDVYYRSEWLEVGGAGMVHPHVLARGGVDPEICNGFAFGFGPDRLALIRYGLTDLRKLWRPNLLMSEDL